ncbi:MULTISPECIES: hypothetical protein [Sporosarcina]|uniref:hypothetical protein n=1 Tax=Sporosarcina TaxID=1569 RepID=UPI00058E02FF|nr:MULTISPECIES: hypothetical protein [Sporosarcina]WJY27508.1 hypothetical protein QWT68_00355 [Sporosarcina sp. 0.2-SM1T-5]
MEQEAKDRVVDEVVWQIYDAHPWLTEKFGDNGRMRTAEDNYHHLNHLETAFQMSDSKFFTDYTKWLDQVLTSRNVGTDLIIDNFERLLAVLPGEVDIERQSAYTDYLKKALAILQPND